MTNNQANTTYFIDQTSEGQHHMVFNAAFISILHRLSPKNQLVYSGIKSSQIAVNGLISSDVKQKLTNKSIHYYTISSTLNFVKLFFFISKEIQRIVHFIRIFLNSHKNDIICLSITTFSSFFFFKFLSLFFNKKVFAILHGDIDFLYKATNAYEKANAFTHKLIFKIKNKNFKYIVLNKICKNSLVNDKYLTSEELIEINHPYFFDESVFNNPHPFQKPIVFAHIGSMEVRRKNSHFIFEIANQLQNEILSKNISFESIGLATNQIEPYKNDFVKILVGEKKENLPPYLPRNQYEQALKKVDYVLFFFPKSEYVFRASGAVIDVIAFEKPIIVLAHPFFENLFLQGGNIGYICQSMEDMIQLIQKIHFHKEAYFEQYQVQVQNLRLLKKSFGIEEISKDISKQYVFN